MTGATGAQGRVLASAGSGPSVLVVEDDPGIATQLVRGLSRGGYRVDHVLTGGEALAWGDPDVILLDNMSPSLAREAVHIVRKHSAPNKIRTEASGGISLDNVREFAEAGVDWISIGALTHSAPAVDLSFEIEPFG